MSRTCGDAFFFSFLPFFSSLPLQLSSFTRSETPQNPSHALAPPSSTLAQPLTPPSLFFSLHPKFCIHRALKSTSLLFSPINHFSFLQPHNKKCSYSYLVQAIHKAKTQTFPPQPILRVLASANQNAPDGFSWSSLACSVQQGFVGFWFKFRESVKKDIGLIWKMRIRSRMFTGATTGALAGKASGSGVVRGAGLDCSVIL
ncbi:hypothetical protein FNV43_RR21613 [Rhamnella rubrinervis]|uniref:Uncharacterized protein n=1 Tax=Rhamnella rubrinervis TaxID=2594499 RepID=A0A8K0DSS6_9ROSA|nr:hypothetical protein FNV43_RR21613 [Rhamnella rubrinervis]